MKGFLDVHTAGKYLLLENIKDLSYPKLIYTLKNHKIRGPTIREWKKSGNSNKFKNHIVRKLLLSFMLEVFGWEINPISQRAS